MTEPTLYVDRLTPAIGARIEGVFNLHGQVRHLQSARQWPGVRRSTYRVGSVTRVFLPLPVSPVVYMVIERPQGSSIAHPRTATLPERVLVC